jgi:pyruvate/2-oxoglutarate dehydrogenase complex dihydrolipoamide dehydrogenase (E3) component
MYIHYETYRKRTRKILNFFDQIKTINHLKIIYHRKDSVIGVRIYSQNITELNALSIFTLQKYLKAPPAQRIQIKAIQPTLPSASRLLKQFTFTAVHSINCH